MAFWSHSSLLARNCCMHAFYILHCTLCFINYVVWVVAIVWFVCRGVICLLKVVDGSVVKGDRVIASSTGEVYDVLGGGLFSVAPPPPPSLPCHCSGLRCMMGVCCSGIGYHQACICPQECSQRDIKQDQDEHCLCHDTKCTAAHCCITLSLSFFAKANWLT